MREKLEKAWMKVGKFLFRALVTALCLWLSYMAFVHRHVILAAIKGEPLPARSKKCPRKCFRKK